jgi:glyoxylase-like metal-dependent hydrolase (beta-lactamase superfamily II)
MKLGQFEIFALSDGTFALDGGQIFGVVPKALWTKKAIADARNRVRLGLTCLLVRAHGKTIVIETGIGDKMDAKQTEIYAIEHPTTLPAELKKLGVDLGDVDIVINTHLHFDHCGWNLRREAGKLIPTFPRARYFVQRGEWEHALRPTLRDRGSYISEFFAASEQQTEFLSGDAEILRGIKVEVVSGHTRYMQCIRIESEGERACFISDLVPTAAHLAYPWIMSLDLYPMETLANKQRLLPELAAEKALVVFPHDPVTLWTRLAEIDGKIVARPVPTV